MDQTFLVVLVLVALLIFVIARTAVIVPQQPASVIENLGKYSRTLQAGFHILIPFVDRVAYRHTLQDDGRAVNSCLVPVAQAAGTNVVPIEGLRGRHPLQRAFAVHGGAQCGICTPGMIMAAAALCARPSLQQVRTGLAGNICRCTGYEGIYKAIKRADSGLGTRGSGLGRQRENRMSYEESGRLLKFTRMGWAGIRTWSRDSGLGARDSGLGTRGSGVAEPGC